MFSAIFCGVFILIVKNNCMSQTKNRLSNVPNLTLPWKFKFLISILILVHWKVMNKLTEWTTYVMCLNSVYRSTIYFCSGGMTYSVITPRLMKGNSSIISSHIIYDINYGLCLCVQCKGYLVHMLPSKTFIVGNRVLNTWVLATGL